jgi:hypothetical protein
MISKCANPACSVRFLYLHEGKLFRFEREAKEDTQPLMGFDPGLPKRARSVEFYWLCAHCAENMTLVRRKGGGVIPYHLPEMLKALKAAS